MITPAKWQAKTDGKPKGSKTADKNEQFRNDVSSCMEKIIFYPDSVDAFDIMERSGLTIYTIRNHKINEKDIKVICKKNKFINSEFEKHDETKISLCNRSILSIIGKVGTLGEGFKQSLYVKNTDHGETSIADTLGFKRQTFVGEQERGIIAKGTNYVDIVQGERVVGYKAIKDLFTTENLDKFKVTTSIMAGAIYLSEDGTTQAIAPVYILGPNQVPKGSFPVIRFFNTKKEAESFLSYYNSNLFRFLFFFGACGSTLTKEFYRYIPDQVNYDHIFTDQELYEKYNLTEEEINIIESVIKERK